MRLIPIIAFMLFSFFGCKVPQKLFVDPQIKFTIWEQFPQDSILLSLRDKYEISYVAGYKENGNSYGKTYTILSVTDNKWYKTEYFKPGYIAPGEYPYRLHTASVHTKRPDTLLRVFADAEFGKIQDFDLDGCDESELPVSNDKRNAKHCITRDAPTNQIFIITKSGFTEKAYYAAEYSNECCPGNKDRDVFVKCWQAIMAVK